MKKASIAMIVGGCVGFVALLTLPWVSTRGGSITLVKLISSHLHGHQVGYFILAPLLLAIVIGAVSLKTSRRWLTVPVAVFLIIPTVLSAVAKGAAIGAHVAMVASAMALIAAVTLTVKPLRE